MNSNAVAIAARDLRKRFGEVIAVDGLDLQVGRGECFGLLGPNGAGKTTTIEMLEGLTPADSGEIEVLGLSWGRDPQQIRERIGISLQETQLTDKLTVLETLRLFRSFYAHGRDPEDLLREFALEEKAGSRVGKLSGGQRQRLAVACALVGDPEVLFLDEPTTGLDPQSRLQLWKQIDAFRAGGGSILLTTHYMDEAERLCDRIAIVDHGRLISLGTPGELISTLEGANVIRLETQPKLDRDLIAALPGVRRVLAQGEEWAVSVDSLAVTVPAILAAVDAQRASIQSLSTHQATLEDLFVFLTGRELRDA
jgi:ABC-2 type transport system ATP-binding protein